MAIPIRVRQGLPRNLITISNHKTQDPRLWLGISFVVIAMIVGQVFLSKASARVAALSVTSDIAQGSLIRESDVVIAQVAIPVTQNLITIPGDAVGKVAATDLFVGDLIQTHSITGSFSPDVRAVSVPIKAGHLPQISRGERVDVWMTPSLDGLALPGPARLIIANAVVEFAPEFYDSGVDTSVTVLVTQDQVAALVQALRDGSIDLVSIPTTGVQP
jgi:hypothetical protein